MYIKQCLVYNKLGAQSIILRFFHSNIWFIYSQLLETERRQKENRWRTSYALIPTVGKCGAEHVAKMSPKTI